MKRLIIALLAMTLSLGALPSAGMAQSLEQAKSRGLVGETQHGYLEARSADPAIHRMVDTINLQRKQNYRDIARKNKTSLEAVEAIVGAKLIGRASPGEYVKDANGAWRRK